MRFFNGVFPYTNLNNLNLDWILDKLKELTTQVAGVEDAAETAQAAADAAQAAADSAIEAVEALPDFTQLTNDVALLKTTLNREVLYYDNVAISAGNNSQIMRIPASGTDGHITAKSVVVSCLTDTPVITSVAEFTSYDGYIVITGNAKTSGLARVTIANVNN